MTITLELSDEQEQRLEEGTAQHDAEKIRQVLMQAVEAAVPRFLEKSDPQLDPATFRQFLDSLANDFANAPPLSDEATSRAGIYGEHP